MPVIADGQRLIEDHLWRRAGAYWPGDRDLQQLRLIRTLERPAARLYWYDVQRRSDRHGIVVKVHTATGLPHSPAVRALRPGEGYVPDRYEREVAALTALNRHFTQLADPRFGTIPILDAIPSVPAIVTERVSGIPMTRLYLRASRIFAGTPDAFADAVQNAGAWLAEWQSLEMPDLVRRRATRAEFTDIVARHCEFLAASTGAHGDLAALRALSARAAQQSFPEELPLAIGHGDFAMRNVLVGPAGRVVVFDTLAVWEAPIYEDLASFVLAARLFRPQAYLAGLMFGESTLRSVQRLLLQGYAERSGPVGDAQIDLYSVLLLLDKWASTVAPASHHRRGVLQTRVLTRWYAREAVRLARRIEGSLTHAS